MLFVNKKSFDLLPSTRDALLLHNHRAKNQASIWSNAADKKDFSLPTQKQHVVGQKSTVLPIW